MRETPTYSRDRWPSPCVATARECTPGNSSGSQAEKRKEEEDQSTGASLGRPPNTRREGDDAEASVEEVGPEDTRRAHRLIKKRSSGDNQGGCVTQFRTEDPPDVPQPSTNSQTSNRVQEPRLEEEKRKRGKGTRPMRRSSARGREKRRVTARGGTSRGDLRRRPARLRDDPKICPRSREEDGPAEKAATEAAGIRMR